MRNIKLIIEYDGTDFFGWQYQPNMRTVQGEIEKSIKQITGEESKLTAAGRTDQGVHALAQVANFKTRSDMHTEKCRNALNAIMPDDIYIKDATEVSADFHARFSAKSKIYQYSIMTKPSPLKRRQYWYVGYKLDIDAMNAVLPCFIGAHDFGNLSVANETHNSKRNTSVDDNSISKICEVYDFSLTNNDFDIILTVEANRFLRKMVRGMIGFIVDVGRGRFKKSDIEILFEKRFEGLYFAPAHGLCLVEVKY